MIDKKQLRQLGWSEDLIREVTRISEEISDGVGKQKGIEEPTVRYSSDSGDSIYFESSKINTSIHISLPHIRK